MKFSAAENFEAVHCRKIYFKPNVNLKFTFQEFPNLPRGDKFSVSSGERGIIYQKSKRDCRLVDLDFGQRLRLFIRRDSYNVSGNGFFCFYFIKARESINLRNFPLSRFFIYIFYENIFFDMQNPFVYPADCKAPQTIIVSQIKRLKTKRLRRFFL